MSTLLDLIAQSETSFAEYAANILNETNFESRPYYLRKRSKGGLVPHDHYKGHYRGVIRFRPNHWGLDKHTKSQHDSHGYGSFCRTHPSHRTCR